MHHAKQAPATARAKLRARPWRLAVLVRCLRRFRRGPIRWLPAFLLAATVAFPGAGVHAELAPGTMLPEWSLDSVDGREVEFPGDAGGAPTVLLFWATWCPYCRALLPHLESLRVRFEPAGVRFYALNIWEDGDPVAYLREQGIGMTLLPAADLVAEAYAIEGTPGVIVGDGSGRVLWVRTSGTSPEEVVETITTLLDAELARAAGS